MFSDQLDESLKHLPGSWPRRDPKDWQAQFYIAQIYGAKHDLAKAREALNKAKALNGENLEIRYQEVKLLETEDKNDEALAALKSILDDTQRRTYSEAEARARSRFLDEYGILSRSDGEVSSRPSTRSSSSPRWAATTPSAARSRSSTPIASRRTMRRP